MTAVSLQAVRFSRRAFEEVIGKIICVERSLLPDQVRYLSGYLADGEVDAKAIVVEKPYIDRHYLAEYQGYYATALRPPPRDTVRLHLFACEVDLAEVQKDLGTPARERRVEALQEAYIGFVVVRPMADVPVGRTVLRTYPVDYRRCFGPKSPPHRVHLFGVTLKAYGVQFHQQDMAVGACATAAVWCALAAVIRRDGGRAPTPLAVTQWANHSQPVGRAFPAVAGLTLEQICAAINASGYSPDVFKAGANRDVFELQLSIYLRSGIPVVLQVKDKNTNEAHAVVAVGFRGESDRKATWGRGERGISLASCGIARLYVHDDRVGPYARMTWADDPEDRASTLVKLDPKEPGFERLMAPLHVWTAVAPLYPKIRISARELLSVATEVLPVLRRLAGNEELVLEASYEPNGAYQEGAWNLGLSSDRAYRVASEILLSRYVGLLRFRVRDVWFADVVCDVTDLHREHPKWGSVSAIVLADTGHADQLRTHAANAYPWISVV